jgi:hypothetical protein
MARVERALEVLLGSEREACAQVIPFAELVKNREKLPKHPEA